MDSQIEAERHILADSTGYERLQLEKSLVESVDGLIASPIRYSVLDELIELVLTGLDATEAVGCLSFLVNEEAAKSWEGDLLRVDLPKRHVTFGPDRSDRVVAAIVAYWRQS